MRPLLAGFVVAERAGGGWGAGVGGALVEELEVALALGEGGPKMQLNEKPLRTNSN